MAILNSDRQKIHEINEMADDYGLYLRFNKIKESTNTEATIALKTLVWQAGEQMEYLSGIVEKGVHDGKQFSMLIGFAYSILACIEHVANLARIGEGAENKYLIYSDTR